MADMKQKFQICGELRETKKTKMKRKKKNNEKKRNKKKKERKRTICSDSE